MRQLAYSPLPETEKKVGINLRVISRWENSGFFLMVRPSFLVLLSTQWPDDIISGMIGSVVVPLLDGVKNPQSYSLKKQFVVAYPPKVID